MFIVKVARIGALFTLSTSCLTIPLSSLAQEGPAHVPVRIAMRAQVGAEAFVCGKTYQGVGTAKSSIEGTEFKYFVHDIRLVDERGTEVPVRLTEDGLWQSGTVALLDFENGQGGCSNGNAELRDVVEGTVPSGTYTGIRLALGVPFERNHQDLTAQPSPLSLSRMFWAWNAGYKFLRLDLKTNGSQNWMVHLGSTECTPTGSARTVPTSCTWQNRPHVALDGFDPARDAIVFDVAALLAGADVSKNQLKTASGCMSAQVDLDCTSLFGALGLSHAGKPAGPQQAFRVERGVAAAGPASGGGRTR